MNDKLNSHSPLFFNFEVFFWKAKIVTDKAFNALSPPFARVYQRTLASMQKGQVRSVLVPIT